MPVPRILIIEDEPITRATLASYLDAQGFEVEEADTSDRADELLSNNEFDLLIIDINLDGKDGLQFTREQRAFSNVGIILLTGLSDEVDRIVGLELGADDYVTKPFNRRELLARIKNLIRRTAEARRVSRRIFKFDGYEFDPHGRRLNGPGGENISITRAEYEILNLLVNRAGEVINREILMGIVTHRNYGTNPRTVDVIIRRLRAKLEENPSAPQLITTAHGEGYVFTGRLM